MLSATLLYLLNHVMLQKKKEGNIVLLHTFHSPPSIYASQKKLYENSFVLHYPSQYCMLCKFTKGPQAPRVLGLGTSQGKFSPGYPQGNLALVTGFILQIILPLGSIVVNIPPQ